MFNEEEIIDLKIDNITDATEEQKQQKLSKKEKAVMCALTSAYIFGIASLIFGTKAIADYNQKLIDDYKNDMYARQEQLMREFEMEHPPVLDSEETYQDIYDRAFKHGGQLEENSMHNGNYAESVSVLNNIESAYTIADYNDIYRTAYDAINMINPIPKEDLVIASFKDATYGDYYKADQTSASKIAYEEALNIAADGKNTARSIIKDGQIIGFVTENSSYMTKDVTPSPMEDLVYKSSEQEQQYNEYNGNTDYVESMPQDKARGYN